jgi:hypothetical protein
LITATIDVGFNSSRKRCFRRVQAECISVGNELSVGHESLFQSAPVFVVGTSSKVGK